MHVHEEVCGELGGLLAELVREALGQALYSGFGRVVCRVTAAK
jgi:hypothetical protein